MSNGVRTARESAQNSWMQKPALSVNFPSRGRARLGDCADPMLRRELRSTAALTWVLAAERIAASDLCPRPAVGEERVRDRDGWRLL